MESRRFIAFTLLFFPLTVLPGAEKPTEKKPATAGVPNSTMLVINRLAAWYESDGEQERIPGSGNAGLYYPAGTTATAIYCAGVLWSGLFYDGQLPVLRMNGQAYNSGTKPGAILGIRTGVSEDPNAPGVRIWRIRRFYQNADLTQDASYMYHVARGEVTPQMISDLRTQFEIDWKEWPAAKGAPFYDHDGDGVYTPRFNTNGDPVLYPDADEPGLAGADEVVWYACNDLGVAEPWDCPEAGIEEQTTVWGYARDDAIGNIIFKRHRLMYKGGSSTADTAHIEQMYFGIFVDTDLGDWSNDYPGCDTVLNMGYTYNGMPTDAMYQPLGLVPPAIGYLLLEGPRVRTDSSGDLATYDFKTIRGYRNLPMTAFFGHVTGERYSDPPYSYTGAIEWNQMMRGFPPQPAGPPDPPRINDPLTGLPTQFWFPGDPVARTGWLASTLDPPGDSRFFMFSGPFSMAIGDTQEVVVADVGGSGLNYLSSVAAMKWNAMNAVQFFSFLLTPTGVKEPQPSDRAETFALEPNYPNPFNPGTTIGYQIKERGYVTMKVYDVLGREVAVLVNGVEVPGRKTVRFNGTDLATGVYFYRLTAGGMSQTRKMLLLR